MVKGREYRRWVVADVASRSGTGKSEHCRGSSGSYGSTAVVILARKQADWHKENDFIW